MGTEFAPAAPETEFVGARPKTRNRIQLAFLFRSEGEELFFREVIFVGGETGEGSARAAAARPARFRSARVAWAMAFIKRLNLGSLIRVEAVTAARYFSIHSCSELLKAISFSDTAARQCERELLRLYILPGWPEQCPQRN